MARHGLDDGSERFALCRVSGLGVEFVGIADDLLLSGYGEHIAVGEGHIAGSDLFAGKSGAGVPFAYQRMSRHGASVESLSAGHAVADIWKLAVAIYGGGVAVGHSDVVKQRGFEQKIPVGVKLRMSGGDSERQSGHLRRVSQQEVAQIIFSGIVAQDFLRHIVNNFVSGYDISR